ncbi:MAG: adenine phosphoribosyltransferase [Candidatus Omnitrophica bacterium]|nr:adenine phosphoribosyltransferase [Candidatus Omnitrophota bacterium]
MPESKTIVERIEKMIRDVPDFPKKGILFKDITPVLNDAQLFKLAIEEMVMKYKTKGVQRVVGIESRGFIFGAPLALRLGAGFVPVRKKGKLPAKTRAVTYSLEYGEDTLEIHTDAIKKGEKVLLVDDLLATGGTAQAVCKLIEEMGGEIVGISFLIELMFLKGIEKLAGYDVSSIIHY